MTKRVAVLGGGVAGLSAAHELVERGFQVQLFEQRGVPGGKARSMGAPGTGKDGRPDLPGEHGFRFFPGFYRHLPDTMKRIPYARNIEGVAGNLVTSTRFLLSHTGKPPAEFVARFPTSIRELFIALKDIFTADIGIPDGEMLHFAERILYILTSCEARRLAEYEKISWWDFIGAETRSAAYQQYLAEGLTRSLVAMQPREGSTRTVGDILIQLLIDITTPGVALDRVLDGPTSDVWITPWREYLRQMGVDLFMDTRLVSFDCVDGRIASVKVEDASGKREVAADYYVAAVPIEVMAPLVTDAMKLADPALGNLSQLKWEWMNGIQFYLYEDVPLVNGHAIFVDTPWALTAISQAQFWEAPMTEYGDGRVKGLLSVDISDWTSPGILYGKPANELSASQIKDEVWAQLRQSLDRNPKAAKLNDANLAGWHLDPDIQFPNPNADINVEPLLVNLVDSWRFRPEATGAIPNLLLASDYVRTYTDLATMEGANEAARRAVNGILAASGSHAPRCELWPLHEPEIFAPARALDYLLFKAGLPHPGSDELMRRAAGGGVTT